jgi:colicin import membrane protein
MAEKRENSVLFSLRELRQIEDDRVKQEEDEAKARAEADRLAREDAVRRAREEEERRVREANEAERRARDEAERRVREDALRLEEAERRARVEAQAKLEEQRLKMEIEAQAIHGSKKKPVGLIIGAVAMLLVVSGLGVYVYLSSQDKIRAEKERAAQIEAEKAELERRMNLEKQAIATLNEDINRQLAQLSAAHDEAERKRLLAEIEEKRKRIADSESRMTQLQKRKNTAGAKPADKGKKVKLNCADDDPLCGAN